VYQGPRISACISTNRSESFAVGQIHTIGRTLRTKRDRSPSQDVGWIRNLAIRNFAKNYLRTSRNLYITSQHFGIILQLTFEKLNGKHHKFLDLKGNFMK
jgi:hypothetical protein